MKKLFIIIALILLAAGSIAQDLRDIRPDPAIRPPLIPAAPLLATRNVSGIVKDEGGQTVIGATVTLKSNKDTIRTATNEEGVFMFKGVKQHTFNVTVNSIGLKTFVQKYAFSDTKRQLVLDPIILMSDSKELAVVTINGAPSIIYKTDTVEYRASDYKVRQNATVDELLRKMEGMEVGTDGSLTHQGTEVVRAKLNGKEYAGGSVAQAIQNLPAEIVEKIQIVDDYGDQAARTGVKEGDPSKILNITTRADRSIGNTARITWQYGNAGRYNAQIFAQRLDANRELGIIGNLRNIVLGVASTGLQGGAANDGGGGTGVGSNTRTSAGFGNGADASGGTSTSGSPSFNYRDQWGKNTQVIGSYAYNFNNNTAINDQYGTLYTTRGNSDFITKSTTERNTSSHNVRYEMDINLDSTNYLQLTPHFSYNNTSTSNNSLNDNINNYTNFEHQTSNGVNSALNGSASYGLTAFYLHVFKKRGRNLSLQVGISRSENRTDGEQHTRYLNFADASQQTVIKDSTAHVLTDRNYNTITYTGSLTYVEPFSATAVLEFSANVSRRNNGSISLQDTIAADGTVHPVIKYSSIYDYNVTDSRGTLNYRYNGAKTRFSFGASVVPFNLSGTKLNAAAGTNAGTSVSNFRVIPAFRFSYAWSRTKRFTLNYYGRNQEPAFEEIQPFTDFSNPNNIIVGNPDLKPSFTHSLTAQFNNYLANSRFNFSLGVTGSLVDNAITQNTLQLSVPIFIDPSDITKNRYRTVYETRYLNLSGARNIVARYNIAKQSYGREVNLTLNGNITYNYSPAMSNNIVYGQTTWRFDERFGPRIIPNENIEVNPFFGYDVSRFLTTLPATTAQTVTSNLTQVNTMSVGITGRMYFFKTWQVNYDATKKYITGITGGNTTPFIINAGFEKEFLARKNLVFTFNVYDLLHQNDYLQQTVNSGGVTNTMSNTLSRYFMVGLRLNVQKWSGTPQRNGQKMQRRGDGSFIYN